MLVMVIVVELWIGVSFRNFFIFSRIIALTVRVQISVETPRTSQKPNAVWPNPYLPIGIFHWKAMIP